MSEQRDMNYEQALLARLAPATAYPSTPDLRAGVMRAIAREAAAPASRGFAARRSAFDARSLVAAAAAVVAAVALAVTLAVPSSRSAVAGFFGIRGEKIERLPSPPPGTTATPFPTPTGIENTGRPSTLDDAQGALGFAPELWRAAPPDNVYLMQFGAATVAVLRYDRFDLWQSRDTGLFEKGLPASALLQEFTIDGNPAAWISGGRHIVSYTNADGTPVAGSQRTVDRNTLVWSTASTNYRIETDLPLEDAVAIAASLP